MNDLKSRGGLLALAAMAAIGTGWYLLRSRAPKEAPVPAPVAPSAPRTPAEWAQAQAKGLEAERDAAWGTLNPAIDRSQDHFTGDWTILHKRMEAAYAGGDFKVGMLVARVEKGVFKLFAVCETPQPIVVAEVLLKVGQRTVSIPTSAGEIYRSLPPSEAEGRLSKPYFERHGRLKTERILFPEDRAFEMMRVIQEAGDQPVEVRFQSLHGTMDGAFSPENLKQVKAIWRFYLTVPKA